MGISLKAYPVIAGRCRTLFFVDQAVAGSNNERIQALTVDGNLGDDSILPVLGHRVDFNCLPFGFCFGEGPGLLSETCLSRGAVKAIEFDDLAFIFPGNDKGISAENFEYLSVPGIGWRRQQQERGQADEKSDESGRQGDASSCHCWELGAVSGL